MDSDISLLQDLGWVTSYLAAETQFPILKWRGSLTTESVITCMQAPGREA